MDGRMKKRMRRVGDFKLISFLDSCHVTDSMPDPTSNTSCFE